MLPVRMPQGLGSQPDLAALQLSDPGQSCKHWVLISLVLTLAKTLAVLSTSFKVVMDIEYWN